MNYVLVVALESEIQNLSQSKHNVIITGVGKINAAIVLTKYLTEHPDTDLVINYGSAGGMKKDIKKLLSVGACIQSDMDCTALGLKKFHTPSEPHMDKIVVDAKSSVTCYTQDAFVTDRLDDPHYCVDMEAYALSKVCKIFKVEFKCFKFISDAVGEPGQSSDWEDNHSIGAGLFEPILKNIISKK